MSASVFRLGYGVVEALNMLREQNVSVRHAPGLRISFAVVDDEGLIFAIPPLLVDGGQQGHDHTNAVRASSEQIERLVNAVLPPLAQNSVETDGSASVAAGHLGRAEIGQTEATPNQIETIDQAIKATPVENFDLARLVNVFAAHIQFYELEVRGTQIQNQTVPLPKSLIGFVRDKATRDRITAAFRLVGHDSKVSGDEIREKAAAIRKRFIKHHPTYGGIILKSSRVALEAEIVELEKLIEAHKKIVRDRFDKDANTSIEELVKAFWRDIARSPPEELSDQLGGIRPTTEQAKDYLRHILAAAFPNADEVAEAMRVSRVVKDVTWNTLNEPGFVEWLKNQYPHRKDLRQPFELFHAAREALKKHGVPGASNTPASD
jgi:hypothetical protein